MKTVSNIKPKEGKRKLESLAEMTNRGGQPPRPMEAAAWEGGSRRGAREKGLYRLLRRKLVTW